MINKKWFERQLLILINFLVFQSSMVDAIANPIIFSQDHHTDISETYTYDEIESASWIKGDHSGWVNWVLSKSETGVNSEVLIELEGNAAKASTTVYTRRCKSSTNLVASKL